MNTLLTAPASTRHIRKLQWQVRVDSSLIGGLPNQWKKLCYRHPDAAELLQLVERAGMDGFAFGSVIVSLDGKDCLVVPYMIARYPICTTLDGSAKEWAQKVEARLPSLLNPKIVFVGFVEGEFGQIGVDRSIGPDSLEHAWKFAYKELQQIVRKERSAGIAFWQFTAATAAELPASLLRDAACIGGQPFGELAIRFSNLQEYLATRDNDMRRYLTRALRNREKILTVRVDDPAAWMDRIYQLYLSQLEGSAMSFGAQSREYFEQVCAAVPGAQFALYFRDEELLAFELLIRNGHRLVSKYFCMDAAAGREYKLYFLSWLENIQYCIDNKIPVLYVGASGEKLKSKLGVKFVSTAVMIQATNPIVHFVIKKMQDELAYESAIELTPVALPSGG